MDRPRIVTIAIILFGASLSIRIFGELTFAYQAAIVTGNVAFQAGRAAAPIGLYAFQGWILWNVAQGKNWSRIAMIVVVLFNVGIAYFVLGDPLATLFASANIVLLQIVGEVVSVALVLFAADYFSKSHGAT